MARPHGRARVDQAWPQAWAVCDRCKFRFNLVDLSYQYQWAGTSLRNTRLKVCRECLDIPQEQLRAFALPGDPIPIEDPRIEPPQDIIVPPPGPVVQQPPFSPPFIPGLPLTILLDMETSDPLLDMESSDNLLEE